jgi:arylsulfatase A-like enzyme
MTPAEQAAHASGYHAAILREDEQIRRILGELERRGALDNTIVIIASDHGEQLGEHDLYNHNNSLYLTALHVPLLVLDPIADPQPTLVGDVVSLRDMAATILDLAGVDADSAGIQGRSLARYWRDAVEGAVEEQVSGADTAFAVLYRGAKNEPWYPVERGPAMYSLTDSAYHYIRGGDGTEELFHISMDPAESVDLAGEPGMESVLEQFRRALTSLAPEATNKGY